MKRKNSKKRKIETMNIHYVIYPLFTPEFASDFGFRTVKVITE
jgi:hypothetical protein